MAELFKRYQVFISSTFLDLVDERREVMQALLELDCIPVGMELFPAANDDQWSYIKKVIDDSDYYILIIGNRYGSTDPNGISFTEKEYDYAISKSIPTISFLHADPDSISVNKSEKLELNQQKLEIFKSKVKTKLNKNWTTASDLGGIVSRSLIKLIREYPRDGYVKSGSTADPLVVSKLREQINTLEELIKDLTLNAPPGIESLSQGTDLFKITLIRNSISNYKKIVKSITWDNLIKLIGPLMLDEATEKKLNLTISSFLEQGQNAANRYQVEELCFGKIISQLISLGYIKTSEKKRMASDKETYWSLTPYGKSYVLKLNAIHRI